MTLWAQYEWDEDNMRALEFAYESYIDQLHAYVFGDVEMEDLDVESTDAFCGCETCWRRETFAFLMPRFIELYKSGLIWDRTQHAYKEVQDGLQLVQDGRDLESGGVQA